MKQKKYETPRLKTYGDITKLTLGGEVEAMSISGSGRRRRFGQPSDLPGNGRGRR